MSQRQQRIESFPTEVRDYNVEKCARWASDFFNVGDFVESTGGTPVGTVTYTSEYSTVNQTTGVVTLEIPATAAAGTRARINDVPSAPSLAFGLAEMDFLWRGRFIEGTPNAGDVYARVGFAVATIASQSAGTTDDGIVFDRAPGETTWRASVYKDSSVKFRKDTGISVASFATMGIWCSSDGKKVVMSINDRVQHVETVNIPTVTTHRVCMDVQATGTITTLYQLKADYMQFRMFPRRR